MIKNSFQFNRRSRLRIYFGKKYYTCKRYLYWLLGPDIFSKDKPLSSDCNYEYIIHHTPLIRDLKDVELFLQYNKVENLKIAISKINNIVIHPGETFSFWRLLGKPTRAKGYKEGLILDSGHLRKGVGGGLCQLTNMLYWMALHTPLTITERYRHSYDVFPDSNRILPFGSGATCVYNYRDLMIKNNTGLSFQMKLWLTDSQLYGCILSNKPPIETYEIYEKDHYFKQELFSKYSRNNIICRKIYHLNGELIKDEVVAENHAFMMYDPLISSKNS
ncbi:VanW family protein [Anaeromicropila herbilytica]|uniref:Vancomycin resistance protein VanW n=1 Tax=Anaeromicropila herbilytica TaxID=2785025 RepID=A0A7R7EL86_9FIRM|nr:VanW family protein [Anaeromicropila herbilytica]BCN30661.1 hypothetical protein bsdtb5_19560 [Anaeromicropila herbilytica]